jgi:hypothetical protein
MEIKSPHIKNAIYQVICTMPNEVSANGQPVPRTSYPKAWAKPALEVKDLLEATMRKEGDYVVIGHDPVVLAEKHLQAVAYFYALHDEVPVTDLASLRFFEELTAQPHAA